MRERGMREREMREREMRERERDEREVRISTNQWIFLAFLILAMVEASLRVCFVFFSADLRACTDTSHHLAISHTIGHTLHKALYMILCIECVG